MRSRIRIFAALLVLVAAALGLRLAGVHTLLPHLPEFHERVYARQVALLREHAPHPELDANYGYYPLLVARLCEATASPATLEPRTSQEHAERCASDLVHIRTVVAWLCVLAVPFTYLLARRFLDARAALLAAAFMAASLMHVTFSQQARPHAPAVGFGVLALLGALNVRRRGDALSYVGAGLSLGLALAMLQSSLAFVPPLLAAHALRPRERSRHAHLWLGVALAIAAVAVYVCYPFLFASSGGLDASQIGVGADKVKLAGHAVFLDEFHGRGFSVLLGALVDYEPWIVLLAVCGAALWIGSRVHARARLAVGANEDLIVVLAFVIPYVLVTGAYDLTYERFALPLLPILCCAAAYAVRSLAQTLGDRAARATSAVVVVTLCTAGGLQAAGAFALARGSARPDTLQQAADWIRENVMPGNRRLAILSTIDVPLLRTAESLRAAPNFLEDVTRPWLIYQAQLRSDALASERYVIVSFPRTSVEERTLFQSDPRAYVAQLPADFVLIEVYSQGRRPALAALRSALQSSGSCVARFSPYGTDSVDDEPLTYAHESDPAFGWWAPRVLSATARGPVVEIYRLAR